MSEAERKRREKEAGKEPTSGDKSKDPTARGNNAKEDPNSDEAPKRDDKLPAWVTALPPEWRDAAKAGVWEKIPARYRELLRRYSKELQKNDDGR